MVALYKRPSRYITSYIQFLKILKFFLTCQFLLIRLLYKTIEENVLNYNYINGKVGNNTKTGDQ